MGPNILSVCEGSSTVQHKESRQHQPCWLQIHTQYFEYQFSGKTIVMVWTFSAAQRPCGKSLDASLGQYWEVVELVEDGA